MAENPSQEDIMAMMMGIMPNKQKKKVGGIGDLDPFQIYSIKESFRKTFR